MRKVKWFRVHQALYVPMVGEIGNTFPSQSKSLDSLDMVTHELGIEMRFSYKGIKKSVLVPAANVIAADLELE